MLALPPVTADKQFENLTAARRRLMLLSGMLCVHIPAGFISATLLDRGVGANNSIQVEDAGAAAE
jgi:hypothetical protein